MTYIVDELARAQEVRADGYVGGIPNQDALFRDIETGNFFNVRQNYINNFWAPWYTIHKIFAGLLDAHRYCRNDEGSRGRGAIRPVGRSDHPETWTTPRGRRCFTPSSGA